MSPTVSLRSLTEPAYVLLGAMLPDDGTGVVEVVAAPHTVERYSATARPIFEYLSIPRSRSEALAELARWDAEPDDLDRLAEDGILVRFPGGDEEGVRAAVETFALGVTAEASPAPDGRSVLLRLPDHRAVVMGPITVAVVNTPTARSLGDGVAAVATESGIPADVVWRRLLVDLSDILGAGAGHLTRTGSVA